MSAFTLRQLEIFVQVVKHGSFRRCADQLGVSQVSISEHVRELEMRLGVQLFDRHAGGPATLTPEGTRAHARVAEILADLDDFVRETSGGRARVAQVLTVAMHPFFMRYLRDAVDEYRALHREVSVELDLEHATPGVLIERVRKRELDVAYFFAFDGHAVPESELVRLEPLAIFVSANHPLAHKERVTAADVRSTPSIHLMPRNPLRTEVDRALEQAGLNGSPTGLETDEYGLILTSVHRGHGFACMFQAAENEVSQANGLVRVNIEHPIPALQVRRFTRQSSHHDPLVAELVERLTKTLKEA